DRVVADRATRQHDRVRADETALADVNPSDRAVAGRALRGSVVGQDVHSRRDRAFVADRDQPQKAVVEGGAFVYVDVPADPQAVLEEPSLPWIATQQVLQLPTESNW